MECLRTVLVSRHGAEPETVGAIPGPAAPVAGPEHLHALVLYKVLLYEEIPRQMRPRVASLQVLTSFLSTTFIGADDNEQQAELQQIRQELAEIRQTLQELSRNLSWK